MKKILIGLAIVGGLLGYSAASKNSSEISPSTLAPKSSTTSNLNTTPAAVESYTTQSAPASTPPPTPASSTSLSNSNYYTNSSGNEVHSPAYSNNNSVPAGATAQCGDGTYSFSQHRSGTCSHHGGVTRWL